ncbi:unnamed protein product [Trichogramma brassicae]|uniref:Protein NDNF n=1 Tax=Trichogramma brassicae TaxID=86971 RepID=A0A6H5HZ74_9HYME|nr:unnamed protein product [Trichogramma brassicae]
MSSSSPPRLQSPIWRKLASLQLLLLLLSSLLLPGRLVGASLLLGNESNPLQRRMASSHQHSAHARKFGTERLSHAEEFNRTKVLQPEYQIRATLSPNDSARVETKGAESRISATSGGVFYYLGPHESGSPPTLLVSPCSGPISWSVSYVGPPDADQHAEGSQQQQSHWPVNQLVPSLPLFKYEGAETRNFTIPAAVTNLYLIEMQPISSPDFVDVRTRAPNTVLMYATSDALGHLPSSLITPTRSKRHQPLLEFQQKWSRRRLIVSWNKNQIEPASSSSSYLLAVTTSGHLHPPTLCTAENILKKHPCPSSDRLQAQDAAHRPEPEGLHCVPRNRITLKGVKYNTTYYFTLYIVMTHGLTRQQEEQISGEFRVRTPALPAGKRFSIQLAASQLDLSKAKTSKVKILAIDNEAVPFNDVQSSGDKPRLESRSIVAMRNALQFIPLATRFRRFVSYFRNVHYSNLQVQRRTRMCRVSSNCGQLAQCNGIIHAESSPMRIDFVERLEQPLAELELFWVRRVEHLQHGVTYREAVLMTRMQQHH